MTELAEIQEDFEYLVECAVRYGLLVQDGNSRRIARAVEGLAVRLAAGCRKRLARVIIDAPGERFEEDEVAWAATLRALQAARKGGR